MVQQNKKFKKILHTWSVKQLGCLLKYLYHRRFSLDNNLRNKSAHWTVNQRTQRHP